MICAPKFIDTKTIIVNLLREDQKEFLSLDRLQSLLSFIYEELWKADKLGDYQISFDVNFDALERTVIYNQDIFTLDMDSGVLYLRHEGTIETAARACPLDETLSGIVHNFVRAA